VTYAIPGNKVFAVTRHTDSTSEWTWIKGLRRAIVWGSAAAVLMAIGLDVGARHWPGVMLNYWVRAALAFAVAWILFSIIHRAAGMAGAICTALVSLLTAEAFVSQHWVFATYGVPTVSGRLIIGDVWLDPVTIMVTNMSTGIALVLATTLCHEGGSIWRTVVDILGARIHG
jgi:hypothetical protein